MSLLQYNRHSALLMHVLQEYWRRYKTNVGGADTVFPFSSAEYPDTLVIFSSAFNDLGGFNYVMNFLGNVYSYAWLTKTGSILTNNSTIKNLSME